MKFKPLGDRVLVKRLLVESKTKKGIIIPENVDNNSNEGVVVAVGEGNINKKGAIVPLRVRVGEHIIFTRWCGTELKIADEKYIIMKESDILGLIKK